MLEWQRFYTLIENSSPLGNRTSVETLIFIYYTRIYCLSKHIVLDVDQSIFIYEVFCTDYIFDHCIFKDTLIPLVVSVTDY